MPSTGTALFTVNRDQFLTDVLKSIRVVLQGATPDASLLTDATVILNMVLKEWVTKSMPLWCYQQILVPMQVGKTLYTIGPTGADVTAIRPLRCFETGNFIRQVVGGAPYDIPLRLISRIEYASFGAKISQGVPNSIYYNPTIDVAGGLTSTSTGYGTLQVYVTSFDATHTIYLNAQRPIFDMTNAGDEFDLPSEWFMALRGAMRYHLGDYCEVPEDRLKRYAAEMTTYLDKVSDWSVEEASSSFSMDSTGGWNSR